MYINYGPQTRGIFADDTCLYATHRKEAFVVRKLQRGLNSLETWCERCNINIMRTTLRGSTSLVVDDRLILISH
jgi:hypothetical protein